MGMTLGGSSPLRPHREESFEKFELFPCAATDLLQRPGMKNWARGDSGVAGESSIRRGGQYKIFFFSP